MRCRFNWLSINYTFMKNPVQIVLKTCIAALLIAGAANLRAQGTAFTYQGLLDFSNSPATGNYDLSFQLYSAATATNTAVVGSPVVKSNTAVANGLFTVTLDFGAVFTGS